MTIFEAYNNTKKRLAAAGIEDSVFEAKAIIRQVTGLSNSDILTNYMNQLTEFQENKTWLRFAFHAENDTTRYASATGAEESYKSFSLTLFDFLYLFQMVIFSFVLLYFELTSSHS